MPRNLIRALIKFDVRKYRINIILTWNAGLQGDLFFYVKSGPILLCVIKKRLIFFLLIQVCYIFSHQLHFLTDIREINSTFI